MWPRPFDSSRRTTLPVPLRMLSSVREAPTFKPAFESTPVVLNNSGYVLSTRVQLRDDERCSDHRGGREKRGANLEMHDCWFSHLGVSSCDDDLALGSFCRKPAGIDPVPPRPSGQSGWLRLPASLRATGQRTRTTGATYQPSRPP